MNGAISLHGVRRHIHFKKKFVPIRHQSPNLNSNSRQWAITSWILI